MKILIFGASGLVGGNMLQYFKTKPEIEVVGTHFSFETENTVPFNTLNLELESNFDVSSFNPDLIINCGALTWVDYCEENEEESYQKTVVSTINTLKIAQQHKAKYLYIGTDYVFDGENGPYTETAEVNPLNIYGRHKLEAENLVLNTTKDSLSLRITNVYGNELRDKNFVSRLYKLAKSGESHHLKLPYDQYATPANALDIAKATYLLLRDQKSGIYNIASTDFVNRMQLAQFVLKTCSEHKITLEPISTRELNPPAKRPLTGGLITAKFLSEYPDFEFSNVNDFLTEKIK
ncbi:MAG: dTDP-4-dehydrorhamnose reductase [Salibacteraceae bacterium]|jgi:dTDP-4-dehydrorhamnose reductase